MRRADCGSTKGTHSKGGRRTGPQRTRLGGPARRPPPPLHAAATPFGLHNAAVVGPLARRLRGRSGRGRHRRGALASRVIRDRRSRGVDSAVGGHLFRNVGVTLFYLPSAAFAGMGTCGPAQRVGTAHAFGPCMCCHIHVCMSPRSHSGIGMWIRSLADSIVLHFCFLG